MKVFVFVFIDCAGVIFADEWGYQKGHDGISE